MFHGDNGQGKTNLLETIYVVGALRSFRTQRMADLIGFDAEQAYIGARIRRGGLERVYELVQRPRSRQVRLDGKAVRPISRYFGDFNVVLFAPEDLQVPRGSPAARRRFLDRAVFNRTPGYLTWVQAYEKVVKNRNALLRDIGGGKRSLRQAGDLLAVFDHKLAELGAQLTHSRLRYLDEIRPRFRDAFGAITQTGLEVDVVYDAAAELPTSTADSAEGAEPTAPGATPAEPTAPEPAAIPPADVGSDPIKLARERLREALTEQLAACRARDLARGTCSLGPHRDDLSFRLNGRAAASFASQGQLRALVLAWKTAEMEMLADTHGEEPVLLLDDVSSELDQTRNEYLFEFLKRRPAQCFITTTHPRHVLLSGERVDYAVSGGVITRESPLK